MELKNKFENWLKKEDIKSTSNYFWPINQEYKGQIVTTNSQDVTYEEIFQFLLSEGNYDWIDRILSEFDTIYSMNKNQKSYFTALKKFLQGEARWIIFSKPKIALTPNFAPGKKPKLYVCYPSFDGMLSLLGKLSVKEILKIMIQTSFFFDNECAKKRYKTIIEKCENNEEIYARGKSRYCPQYPFLTQLKKDTDGNRKVCDLIKEYFGYILNREDKNFFGYTISHIWGRASNPLFFTNLLNLALIPDWINHLMDKYSSTENFGSNDITVAQKKALQIVNTIRRVAFEYYQIQTAINGTVLRPSDFPIDNKYVKKGEYVINVIKPINNNSFAQLHGNIVHATVKI